MPCQKPSVSSQHTAPVIIHGRKPSSDTLPHKDGYAVVFVDGDCLLCNGFVDILIRLDSNHRVLISTLEGKTAQRYLPPLPKAREAWSIVYWDEQGFHTQSQAFVRLGHRLGGWLSVLSGIVQIIPAPIRNAVYRFVGRNRYRWFGRRSTCRFLTEKDQARFLP